MIIHVSSNIISHTPPTVEVFYPIGSANDAYVYSTIY